MREEGRGTLYTSGRRETEGSTYLRRTSGDVFVSDCIKKNMSTVSTLGLFGEKIFIQWVGVFTEISLHLPDSVDDLFIVHEGIKNTNCRVGKGIGEGRTGSTGTVTVLPSNPGTTKV